MTSPIAELGAGLSLLLRGVALVTRRPRMFLMAAIPPAITSVLFVIILVAFIAELDVIVGWLTAFADDWSAGLRQAVQIAMGVALVGALVLLMVISFTALTLALGSPVYDKLSESVEAEFGPVPTLEEPAVRGVLRALRQAAALIAVSVAGAVVLFVAGFLPFVGQTVVPVVSATFGGWLLAIELVGSTFERRGKLTLGERRAALRRHRLQVLGFAVPTFLLLAIPFAGVVVFPVATAGATLLARRMLGEPVAQPSGAVRPGGA